MFRGFIGKIPAKRGETLGGIRIGRITLSLKDNVPTGPTLQDRVTALENIIDKNPSNKGSGGADKNI